MVTTLWKRSMIDLLQLGRAVSGLMIGYLMIKVVNKPFSIFLDLTMSFGNILEIKHLAIIEIC